MKKVISLALCVMMIASICAMGVNAAVPVVNTVDLGCNNGEGDGLNAFSTATPSTGASATKILDGTNNVYEFAFTAGGMWDYKTGYYVLYGTSNMFGNLYDDKDFEITVDVKPIVNSTGIGFSLHPAGYKGAYWIYPAALETGKWNNIKLYWSVMHKKLSVYVKEANEAEYRLLTAGEGYYKNANGALSSYSSYFALDTRLFKDDTAKDKYDAANILNAKYYIDNFSFKRFDPIKCKNVIYTENVKVVFDTTKGATGIEYKFPAAHDASASTRTITFDAIKTGGDRPVHLTYAPKNGGTTFTVNIWNAPQDVKYTYKVDYYQGSLKAVSRKAEGSNVWETLTAGVDYSKGGPYGAWQYLKFGYLGEYYKNDAAHLLEYCGPNPALDDVNTVWTFSNFQITGYNPAISAAIAKTETGSLVRVGAVAQSENFAVMVAVFDGDKFVAADVANINHEGTCDLLIDHNVETPTFKAFVWNTANESAPMMEITDITSWVEKI